MAATITALSPGDRLARLPGIQAFFGRYRGQLAMHHRHEDELFFPALAARIGADRMQLTELTGQHERLDAAVQAVYDGLADLAAPAPGATAVTSSLPRAPRM